MSDGLTDSEKTISVGGRDFVLPPLTLRQLRDIVPIFAKLPLLGPQEGLDASVDIIVAALAKKYPEVTTDFVYDTENLTFAMMTAFTNKVAVASGLVPSGEAKATPSPSTGDTSTAA